MDTETEIQIAEAATPGPWTASRLHTGFDDDEVITPGGVCSMGEQKRMIALQILESPVGQPSRKAADIEFIAHARTGYPLALAVVEAAEYVASPERIEPGDGMIELREAIEDWRAAR